jgi:hypothetical protein
LSAPLVRDGFTLNHPPIRHPGESQDLSFLQALEKAVRSQLSLG